MDNRLSKQNYFFFLAKAAALRATCPSRSVGCIIVDAETDNVVATGYNGAPRGTTHCGEACQNRKTGSSYEKCKAVHAELNAIAAAAMNGVTTRGKEMYLTTTPCIFCSRVIINAGIKKVYALTYYAHPEALELLNEGGVDVVVVNGVEIPSIFINRSES